MTRVLVTGASGFVGTQVVAALARSGAEVFAVSRRPSTAGGRVTWLQADLLDPDAARRCIDAARPEVVIHLAWCVEHGVFWTSPQNLDWIAASLRLAQAAVAGGVRRLVGTGTCVEYEAPDFADCDEASTPINPKILYGVAKDATRRVLQVYLAGAGVEFAWGRLFLLYGPGEGPNRLVPSICRALAKGQPALCSRGSAVRDFMDVRDTGAALVRLSLSDVVGCINVASGHAVSVADLARRLGELAGRPELVHLGAIMDRPDDPPRISARVCRLSQEIGFTATRSLDQGLTEALEDWSKAR